MKLRLSPLIWWSMGSDVEDGHVQDVAKDLADTKFVEPLSVQLCGSPSMETNLKFFIKPSLF